MSGLSRGIEVRLESSLENIPVAVKMAEDSGLKLLEETRVTIAAVVTKFAAGLRSRSSKYRE